ncbi:MAG: hypothetical protein ABL901_10215 [Hyphomicrobiaceae bacterium]
MVHASLKSGKVDATAINAIDVFADNIAFGELKATRNLSAYGVESLQQDAYQIMGRFADMVIFCEDLIVPVVEIPGKSTFDADRLPPILKKLVHDHADFVRLAPIKIEASRYSLEEHIDQARGLLQLLKRENDRSRLLAWMRLLDAPLVSAQRNGKKPAFLFDPRLFECHHELVREMEVIGVSVVDFCHMYDMALRYKRYAEEFSDSYYVSHPLRENLYEWALGVPNANCENWVPRRVASFDVTARSLLQSSIGGLWGAKMNSTDVMACLLEMRAFVRSREGAIFRRETIEEQEIEEVMASLSRLPLPRTLNADIVAQSAKWAVPACAGAVHVFQGSSVTDWLGAAAYAASHLQDANSVRAFLRERVVMSPRHIERLGYDGITVRFLLEPIIDIVPARKK